MLILLCKAGRVVQSDNDLSSAVEPPIRRGAAGEELNCEVQQKQSRADDIPTITIEPDQNQILYRYLSYYLTRAIYIKLAAVFTNVISNTDDCEPQKVHICFKSNWAPVTKSDSRMCHYIYFKKDI